MATDAPPPELTTAAFKALAAPVVNAMLEAPEPSHEPPPPEPSPSEPAMIPVTPADWYGVPPDELPDRLRGFYIFTVKDVVRISQGMYGEDRGPSITRRAAVCWNILNRLDQGGDFGMTIQTVITPGFFHGYSPHNPIWSSLQNLAIDVITRWYNEQLGIENVGRVLPEGFLYFSSDGHLHNNFRTTFSSKDPDCKILRWNELDYTIYES
jgi:hypothetical protein